jgi:hypothetical protein
MPRAPGQVSIFLSPHFTLAELVRSNVAVRRGFPNDPDDDAVASLRALAVAVLEPVRALLGVPLRVESGYRSPVVNAYVGGSTNSQHCLGEAVDVTLGGADLLAAARKIAASGVRFDQLILELYDACRLDRGWIHLSHAVNKKQRHEVLTAARVDGSVRYSPGLPA